MESEYELEVYASWPVGSDNLKDVTLHYPKGMPEDVLIERLQQMIEQLIERGFES